MVAPAPVFIVNHLSERVARKGSVLESIAPDCKASLFSDNIFDNLDKVIQTTVQNKQNWVFIEGGDGTAQGVITAFMRAYQKKDLPCFTLIPGGMTNQVAGVIGLKSRRSKDVLKLLQTGGKVEKHALLNVNPCGSNDAIGQVGFLFSTGAIPMITEYTKSKLHSRGIGGTLAVIGGILKGVKGRESDIITSTDISIKVEGKTIKSSHLGTVATTLPSIMLGLDPFWEQSGKGDIKLTLAHSESKKLLSNIFSLWCGNHNKDRQSDGLESLRSKRVDFNYNGPVVLDGETLNLLGPDFMLSTTQKVTFLC